MPLYDYECSNCGHRVEVLHGVHDSGPATCERCGGTMRKLLATPAIVFKGSGWAKKDARDAKPAKSPASASSGETSKIDAGSSSSGDSSSADASTKQKSGDSGVGKSDTKGSAGSTAAD